LEVLTVEEREAPARGRRRQGVSAEPVSLDLLSATPTRVIPKSDTERKQIQESIKGNFLFSTLDAEQMKIVIDAMEAKEYKAGETIIKQGEDGAEFFELADGSCECYLDMNNGQPPRMVKKYEPGDGFGELALMYNCPRAATIKALTDCHLWAMDRMTFRKVLLFTTAKKRDQYEEFLERVPLLSSLDKYERSRVADALVEVQFAAGEYILRAGDILNTNFYILAEGRAVATKLLDGDKQAPVQVMAYDAGGFFGELALLRNEARAANIVAETNCKCVYIDKASFNRLLGPCEDILKRNQSNYEEIELRIRNRSHSLVG
jgi:cAMP-dependent protein kinase regulator